MEIWTQVFTRNVARLENRDWLMNQSGVVQTDDLVVRACVEVAELSRWRCALNCADQIRPPRPRLDWAALMKRVFATDVLVCDAGGGAMRIIAVIPKGDASHAILEHLGLPVEPRPPRTLAPPDRPFEDA